MIVRRIPAALVSVLTVVLLSSRLSAAPAVAAGPGGSGSWGGSFDATLACQISREFLRYPQLEPVSGVTVLTPSGGSTVTDGTGRWRLDVPENSLVKVRVISQVPVAELDEDGVVMPPGTTELTYRVSGRCQAFLVDVEVLFLDSGRFSQPAPPPLPQGFTPVAATLATAPPPALQGNPGNVPWLGTFWLNAPEVPVGVCGGMDAATRAAAEAGIQRWIDAVGQGLAWKLVRNDDVCDDAYDRPRIVITQETVSRSRAVLGATSARDLDGQACRFDTNGTPCWVKTAKIALNPPGFGRLRSEEQIATVVHELGHALGLDHARGCGDSIMWFDASSCKAAPLLQPGNDDLTSLNELLAVTLRALQAPPSSP